MKRIFILFLPFRWLFNGFEFLINLIASLWFNFSFLPLSQAVKMPIWLVKPFFVNINRMCKTGKVIIVSEKISFRMIKLGVRYNSWNLYSGIKLQLYGNIEFHGPAVIGNSSTIYVANNANLSFGRNFIAASRLTIVCQKSIIFSENALIGWNCDFYDTDFHNLTNNETGEILRRKAPVFIGKNNWIGCYTMVFKGFKSNDDIVIGAHSICKSRIASKKKSLIASSEHLVVVKEDMYYNSKNDNL